MSHDSHTIVRHFENHEGYWVSCGKLRTYLQHHDIVATSSQKAEATKSYSQFQSMLNSQIFHAAFYSHVKAPT